MFSMWRCLQFSNDIYPVCRGRRRKLPPPSRTSVKVQIRWYSSFNLTSNKIKPCSYALVRPSKRKYKSEQIFSLKIYQLKHTFTFYSLIPRRVTMSEEERRLREEMKKERRKKKKDKGEKKRRKNKLETLKSCNELWLMTIDNH